MALMNNTFDVVIRCDLGLTSFRVPDDKEGYRRSRYIKEGNDVYAAVVKSMSIRVLLALAAIHDREAQQLDVMNAFLNEHLTGTTYMEMPHRFSKKGIVCLLLKTLYGLCQSPREW